MAPVNFSFYGNSLYVSESNTPGWTVSLYYLMLGPGERPPQIGFNTAWVNRSGAYFFLPSDQPTTDAFVNALLMLFPNPSPESRWLAWIPSAKPQDVTAANVRLLPIGLKSGTAGDGRVLSLSALKFGNLELVIQAETYVAAADPAGAVPIIRLTVNPVTGRTLTLRQTNTSRSLDLPVDAAFDVPLASAALGAWQFPMSPNRGAFYQLFQDPNDNNAAPSAEIRMAYESDGVARQLRYPVLLGALEDPLNPPAARLPMKVSLDVLNPADFERTRMTFDLAAYAPGGPVLPLSYSFRTTAGLQIRLKPVETAGFGLARRPGPNADISYLYLAPAGPYEAQSNPQGAALVDPIAKNALLVMCGLSGVEFLMIAEQDRLEFLGQFAANAVAFGVSGPPSQTVLDNKYSTAWVRLVPGPKSGETFKSFIKQSYCVQAPNAIYFSAGANGTFPFPTALGARLRDLADISKAPVFPMAPYGWAYYSDPANDINNPNPDASGELLSYFEQQAISLQRRASINVDECLGPLFFDLANLQTLSGGFVQTSRGLLVELNNGSLTGDQPAGSWKRLILARSPDNPAQILQFLATTDAATRRCTAPPPYNVVSPLLSTALTSNAPFLVVTLPQPLGSFDNVIQLGDYPFVVNVNGTDAGPSLGNNTVLLFKLATDRSVKDWAADPQSWTDADVFVNAGTATRLSGQIGQFIAEAKAMSDEAKRQGAYDYFANFLEAVESPSWSGVLVLNPPLDLSELPVDIQALRGGMRSDKPLRGHHLGIALNQIPRAASAAGEMPLGQSSLFGLVHYDEEFVTPSTDYDFQVLKLNALFDNSILIHFDSRIAWSTSELFGDRATMIQGGQNDNPATNTIVIDGALQSHDGETSIVFASDETRVFQFTPGSQRVIDKMAVFGAALQPVDSQASGGTTIVHSAFVYNGSLGFSTGTPKNPDADLFSFALDPQNRSSGMQYTSYDFAMVTTITGESASLAPIEVNLAGMQVAASQTTPRPDSLFSTLPLKLVKFRENVSVSASGSSRQVKGTGLDDITTLRYAFEMQMVMGTLGALSNQSPLQGALLLGWNPGNTAADKAGMIFDPPAELSNAGFKLQGVVNTQYSSVKLDRPKLTNDQGSIHVFTLSLTPVDFSIIGLPLVLGTIRSITFFGSLESGSPDGTNLAWFVGKPLQSAATESTAVVPAAAVGPSLIFVPLIGVIAGLKAAIDAQATQVVGNAIDVLNKIPIDTQTTLDEIYKKTATLPVTYDPAAGVTAWIDIEFPNVVFKAIFSDPAIYGGRIEIASAPENAKGLWKALGGLVVEIAYRKISDELGAWSGFVTLPDKFRKIKFSEQLTLYLPTVGVIIYTNGDWRVDVGWPFSPDTALRLDFTTGGIPYTFGVGFYLAKLRSADDPATFGDEFALIWRFGLGLMFGKTKKWEKGPLSLDAGIYGFITFEGFLASKDGAQINYHWYAGQLGVVAYVKGEAKFKIVSASISFEAGIVAGVAVETDHRTVLVMIATVAVELSIKIIFVRITFSFSATFEILNWSFGDGPLALTSGPTPTALPAPAPRQLSYVQKELHPRVLLATDALRAAAVPIDINLYFTLQSTAIASGAASVPQAIASLLIELLPDKSTIDDFAKVVQGVAGWLFQNFAGAPPLSNQLQRILLAIDSGAFEATLIDCLSSTFKFHLWPATVNLKGGNAAIFPIFPQLRMIYNGVSIPFDQPVVPNDYAHQLSVYFSQLASQVGATGNKSLAALSSAGVPQSPAGIVFGDLFNAMGKQLVSQMQDLADEDPNMTFQQALAKLGPAGYKNIAGAVTRYAQYGLRLPTPDSQPFGAQVAAIFALTRQQQALVSDKGLWNTVFELRYGTANVQSWIVFEDKGGAEFIKEAMNQSLVLTQPIDPKWLVAGGGFQPLPPIRPAALEYYLGDQQSWQLADGKSRQMRPFSGALQQYVIGHAPLVATVRLVDQSTESSEHPLPGDVQNTSAGLFIGLQLAQIPDRNGVPIEGVYRLIGTNDFTRSQIEDIVSTTAVNTAALHFLAPLGSSNYRSSVKDASIVLAKTNLSTLTEPPASRMAAGAAPSAPPTSAKLSDVANFLWLTWEVSVVHSGGYYLYVEDLPESAFADGPADIAVLVTFGTASTKAPMLERYHNTFVFDNVPDPAKTVSVGISDLSQSPVEVYQQNYDAGAVGFQIVWPNAPVDSALNENSKPEEKAAFLVALYSILQYRVAAIQPGQVALAQVPQLPSNWSLPIGPRGASDWTFSETLAVADFLGESNRFTPIGMNVSFDVTLLDVYGNALPAQHPVPLEVVYNDPLAPIGEWPWMSSSYSFRIHTGNQALLTVLLHLDPLIADDGDPDAQRRTIADAAAKYRLIADQLTDPNTSASVSSTLFQNALLTDRNGQPVVAVFAQYITGTVLPYIATLSVPPYPPPPSPLVVEFIANRFYVTTIATDIFELAVATNIWRRESAVKPEIKQKIPSVQSVTSPLAAMPNPPQLRAAADPPDGGNDTTLRAFAKEFETAWAGFDGKPSSGALLKVCEGAPAATTSAGETNRQLWAVRVGKDAGISAAFPNAGSQPSVNVRPAYFSPIPLSTQLLTGAFNVRLYDQSKIQDLERTFSNIDLDVWARSFLLAYEGVLSPEMSTATATLDSRIFARYLSLKEHLASEIQNGLEAVLDIPGLTPDPKQARERFFQALLNSLSADYTIASVVAIGADVTVARKVEPKIPPNLYGDISADTIRRDQAVSLTPAKLPTTPGRVNLPFAVSTTQPANQAFLDITPTYEIGFIEHDFDPGRQRFGYVPSSWITFIDPVFNPAGGVSPLSPPMGRNQIPIPLRAYPNVPALPSQAAVTSENPSTLEAALQWTYDLTIAEQPSPQDSLIFRLIFNESAKSKPVAQLAAERMTLAAAPGADPPRSDPANLFEALARFTFEFPQIAPDLAKVPAAAFRGQDVKAAQTALERFGYLVQGVDQTWAAWKNTLQDSRARRVARLAAPGAGPLVEDNWVYTVEFKDLPRLVVTRAIDNSKELPLWPQLEGFRTPTNSEPEGIYEPIGNPASSSGLHVSVPGLFMVTRESVRASAYVERNSNLVPDNAAAGTKVNPAFVYRTPVVELTDSVIPLQDVASPIVMPAAPNLTQAITDLFLPFITPQDGTQDQVEELRFELGIFYRYRIAQGDEAGQSLYTRIPVFLVQEDASVGPKLRPDTRPLAEIKKEMADSLAVWYKTFQPGSEDASLDLECTLFDLISEPRLPFARFRSIVIPVPENNPAWWK